MFASRIGRVSNFCVTVTVLLSVPLLTGVCLGANPYRSLIVSGSDYADLRARASQEPWAWMKAQAITKANNGYGSVGTGDYSLVQSCLTSSALSYILDVSNQTTYKNRIYDGIVNQLDNLNIGDSHGWAGVVMGGNTVFAAINALDVVYNDLTTTQRNNCWNEIQGKVNLISTSGNWPLARKGLRGTWDIFKGVSYNPATYYNEVMADLTTDGVFKGGSGYAFARYNGSERSAKCLFMDILEHTGVDNRYYDNSRIQDFHEWMYSAMASPTKKFIPFGDTCPSSSVAGRDPLYRAAKFGDTAAGYAGWFTHDGNLQGDLYFSYVIPDALYVSDGKVMPAPAAVAPKSKVYMEGGGWFWEDNVTSDSLMGAVWAATGITSVDAHAHKESNAIYMAAYGEHVLMNSGYVGYGSGWGGYSWDWFNNNARSANTVLVNNADHSSKCGGGVEEGFTSHGFDYSCSNDGPALSNDTHLRSFIFVKPQDGKNGYFVLFDEVDADPGETVNVLLHPNTKATTGITTVSYKQEYRATIDGMVLDGNTDVKLSVFYGTAPTSVTKENGAIGDSSLSFEGKYLNAKYNTDSSGNVQAATVLFPHDNTHAKAYMSRIAYTLTKGVFVNHGGGVEDYVLTSNGTGTVGINGASFIAKSVVFRKNSGDLEFYFARDGRKFLYDGIGFESDSAISIHMDIEPWVTYDSWGHAVTHEGWTHASGKIRGVSTGTYVKFWFPGELLHQLIFLNGHRMDYIVYGDGWIRTYVEGGGTYNLDICWYINPNPEPASAAILLVGAIGILRRRKRKS